MARLIALLLAAVASATPAPNSLALVSLAASDVGSGPYYLDQAGETYLLLEDIEVPGSAFVFAAHNVTLDLNAKTVTFGDVANQYRYGIAIPPGYAHVNPMWSQSDITRWISANNAVVRNGHVLQGAGRGASCAAIVSYDRNGITLSGVSIIVNGDDTFAIELIDSRNILVHDNIIIDSTDVVTNRHSGRAAIDLIGAYDGSIELHDNTIHNCRQWGIRISRRQPINTLARVYSNLVYPNTIVTNGYGVGIHGDLVDAYDNIIDATNGRGIQIELCGDVRVYRNTISVTEQPIWSEYNYVSAHGIKLEDCRDTEVFENHVVSHGLVNDLSAVSNGAALVIAAQTGSNNRVYDNTFVARHLGGAQFDPNSYGQFAGALEFIAMQPGTGLVIEDNLFVTNDRFCTLTSWSGTTVPADARDITIRRNRWIREPTEVPTRKYDIFQGNVSVQGLRFLDNEGGNFRNYGSGWPWAFNEWGVAFGGLVRTVDAVGDPVPGIPVEIRAAGGDVADSIGTDINGEAPIVLDEFSVDIQGYASGHVVHWVEPNPHTFSAAFPEGTVDTTRNVDAAGFVVTIASQGGPADVEPPSSVTNLAVPSTTQTTATLTWTAVGDDGNSGTATTYDLRRSTSPITAANFASATEASGEPTPKAAGQPETFTVTGLTASTTYYFALKVADEVPNWSAISNVTSGTTLPPPDTTPPSGVTNLAIPSTTQTTATLTWTSVGDDGNSGTATTYDLRRSTNPITAANFASAPQVSGEPTPKAAGQPESFTVTGLTAGTTYHFALKVADEVPNWSAISNVVSGTTLPPPDTTPPSGVTNLAVLSTTQTTATLTWTAVGDDGNSGTATTYDLRYSTAVINAGNWGSALQVTGEPAPQAAGQPETFTVTGLTAGTTYYFALKVADEVPNWSALSNLPSAATQEEPPPPPPPADITPPATVANLTADAHSQNSVHLTWTAVGDDGGDGTAAIYDLRYAQTAVTEANWDQATQATGEPAPDSSGQAQDFSVDGLAPGTTYFFVLKVGDEVPNWSGLSNVASRQTSSPPPPPPPLDQSSPSRITDLTIDTIDQLTATLTWTAPGDDGDSGVATAYDLRYSTAPIQTTTWDDALQIRDVSAPRPAGQPESLSVSGLTEGTTYFFALKAADEVPNWSELSNVVSGTTPVTPPPPPPPPPPDTTPPAAIHDLTSTDAGETWIVLAWTAPGDDGGTGRAHLYQLRSLIGGSVSSEEQWQLATPIVTGLPDPLPAGTAQAFTVSGLTAGTTYGFAIRALDESGNLGALGAPFTAGTLSPPPPPPPPPPADTSSPAAITDLLVSSTTETTATLTWTAVGDDELIGTAASYDLRSSTSRITPGSWARAREIVGEPLPAAAGETQSFTVTDLSPGTTYYFALKVADEVPNWGDLSNLAEGTTLSPPPPPPPDDTTPPADVRDLTISAAGTSWVELRWTAVGDDGASGTAHAYDLRYSSSRITPGSWSRANPVSTVPSPPRAAGQPEVSVVPGLASGLTYHFALKVRDEGDNWSGLSNVPSGATQISGPQPPSGDPTPPAAIDDLAAVATTDSTITLTWTAPGDDGDVGQASSYQVRYLVGSLLDLESEWEQGVAGAGEILPPAPAGQREEYTVQGLTPGVAYGLAVRARDEQGNLGPLGLSVLVTTGTEVPPVLAPTAVTELRVVKVESRLAWLALRHPENPAGTVTTHYEARVQTSPIDSTSWATAGLVEAPEPGAAGTETEWTITGLEPATTYYLAVRAFGLTDRASPLSPSIEIRTPGEDLAPPDPPGAPRASWSADGTRVTLQWSPSTDSRVTGYLLYAQGPSTGWFRLREEILDGPTVELDRPDPKLVRRLAVRATTAAGVESALSVSLDLFAHEWQLEGPFPHPITDRCRFVVSVPADFPEGTRLRVEILSLHGEREALLHDAVVFPGSSVEVFWDRKTTAGKAASPGFHYVLCTGNGRRTMRTVYVGP